MPARVAIDTNVLLSGIIWPRWQHAVLQHGLRGDIELVLPEIVIAEARNQFVRNFPEYLERFERFLASVELEFVPLPKPEQVRAAEGLVRQAEDIPVALSVIAAGVDFFVTYDRDFTDEHESTAKVRAAIPGICLPPVFLRDVMGWTSEELEAIRHQTWADLSEQP